MSFNLRNIREYSTDPSTKFISHLAKRISDFANASQTQDLENKEDIYSAGQDVDSRLAFHSFTKTKYFDLDTEYFPTFEPDLDKLRLWIRGYNIGNETKDWSEYGRITEIVGEPLLIDGSPFDDGTNTGGVKSTALRFNSPAPHQTSVDESINVNNHSLIRVSEDLTTGISFFMRFRMLSLANHGGEAATLFEKTDTNPITDGIRVCVTSDGKLQISYRNSSIAYARETSAGTITTNTVYDLWITFNKTGNVVKAYLNNVEKSLSTISQLGWHADQDNFDLSIMTMGIGTSAGNVYGDLYDFRIYREKVVNTTEIDNMYTNKWTIYNIPFGQVMVIDYYSASASDVGLGSFTSTSFTSQSFSV